MSLPERAVKVLMEFGYDEYFTEGAVDFHKIAATNAEALLKINGIGNAYLRNIARELDNLGIMDGDEWLDGKVLVTNIGPAVEKEQVPKKKDSTKKMPVDRDDIRAMQAYFFFFISPNSLSLEALQWLNDNIGIENLRDKIIEKIYELNLWDRYSLHVTLRREAERLSKNSENPKRLKLIWEIINYNKYVASAECKRFFHQGYWEATIAFWIFMDANGIKEEEELMDNISIRISKSTQLIKNMGYDTNLLGLEDIVPTLLGEEK